MAGGMTFTGMRPTAGRLLFLVTQKYQTACAALSDGSLGFGEPHCRLTSQHKSGSLPNAEPAKDAVQKVFRVDGACDLAQFVQREADFSGDQFFPPACAG
jgi:hypothetical protein